MEIERKKHKKKVQSNEFFLFIYLFIYLSLSKAFIRNVTKIIIIKIITEKKIVVCCRENTL